MKIRKFGKNFKVESSTKGKDYVVDPLKQTCTCPHYSFRIIHLGGECKHLKAVREMLEEKEDTIEKRVMARFETKKEIDAMELIDEFGEIIINDLVDKGVLMEEKGKLRVLK